MNDDKEINVQEAQPDTKVLSEAADQMDKEIFFTASMAKKKTVSVHKKRLEVEMLPIYQKINEAINKGNYLLEAQLTKDQVNFLSNKNFRLSCIKYLNGESVGLYRIYWN